MRASPQSQVALGRHRFPFAGAALLLAALAGAPGCGSAPRPDRTPETLLAERKATDDAVNADTRRAFEALAARAWREQEDYAAGRSQRPPSIDVLVISGGGDWGAFGAGFLRGWKSVPAGDALAMPEFDAVTGVSTGALIAPFAFLGDEAALTRIDTLYRHPQSDWVRQRGLLYFLPNNLSFAEVPGLERELRANVTPEMVARIAEVGGGRILAVNTTNLDDAGPRVFDLVAESRKATETGDLDRLHSIMLASAGIPGAFPFREIDGQMYVDGGVTANIIYGGRLDEEESLPAVWQRLHPGVPMPPLRYWLIFNNKLRVAPAVVEPRWPPIVTRALELSTRSATLTAMRHLHAMAEVSRLKRGAQVEVRLVAVPNEWTPPVAGVFIAETMNDLADLGQRMGADPASWSTTSP